MLQSVVVLTGAGISAESGISTFRGNDGLWEKHRIEDVASQEAFSRDPELVHRFYNQRRRQLFHEQIQPNRAHAALAKFEKTFPGEFLLVTQNIDPLHEMAGSERLLHMHGELLRIRCQRSGILFDCFSDITIASRCECCGLAGSLRPHVVWFGEMPLYMDRILPALESCDLFIAIGTSGNVYPAAGFHGVAKCAGAQTVELNLEPTFSGSRFDRKLYGTASEVVPQFLETLIDESS